MSQEKMRGERKMIEEREKALRTIDIIEQQVLRTGRVDSERDQFNTLRILVRRGEMKPEDAVARANKIVEERQDYN